MSASPQATFSGPHLIFVLAGQSNMAGRGALDQALPQNPRILLLSGEDGQGQWQVAEEPTHAAVDAERLRLLGGSKSRVGCGTGPALFFAQHLLALVERDVTRDAAAGAAKLRVGLVPAAVGGTAISAWQPKLPLFEHMLRQTRRALDLPQHSLSPTSSACSSVAALLWHQGESDTDTPPLAHAYSSSLAALLRAARAQISCDERLPVLICGIWGREDRVPHKEAVRAAQLSACEVGVCEEERADAYVETCDLEFQDDGLHLTAKGAEVLGQRMAEAVWSMPCVQGKVRGILAELTKD